MINFISSRFEGSSCCSSVGGIALPSSFACSRILFLQKVRYAYTQLTDYISRILPLNGAGSSFSFMIYPSLLPPFLTHSLRTHPLTHSLTYSLTLVQLLNQSINQSINQSVNQSINQSMKKPNYQPSNPHKQ